MRFIILVSFISIVFLPVISISNLVRKVRSATKCSDSLARNFSTQRLEVFLTVNSLAKIFWNGKIEKRRLELNWVNPPDTEEADYIGLYRDDPRENQTDPLLRIPASYPGQYYLTSVKFPEMSMSIPNSGGRRADQFGARSHNSLFFLVLKPSLIT